MTYSWLFSCPCVRGATDMGLILLSNRATLPSDLQAVKINCIIKCLPFHQSGSQAERLWGHVISLGEYTSVYSKQNEIMPDCLTDVYRNTGYQWWHRVYKITTLKQMKAAHAITAKTSKFWLYPADRFMFFFSLPSNSLHYVTMR